LDLGLEQLWEQVMALELVRVREQEQALVPEPALVLEWVRELWHNQSKASSRLL
jgi:hypothetical protein